MTGHADEAGAGPELFPHDRVVFFSDAVFAIAMTLLAVELKTPSEELIARVGENLAWGETVSVFIAYLVSFLVCALFWVGHMLTWKHIARATPKLVWCTVFQLMFVALMPFATRLYSEAFNGHSPGRFAFYSFVLAGIALFNVLTRWVAVRQENLRAKLGATQVRWLLLRGMVPLLVFAAGIPLAFVLPMQMGGFMFALILPLNIVARRLCLRRTQPEPAA
ncbi:TMEM175 family protein [Xanthomonas massiliensis]|uniref:TMEM175 family protein n=1 Tax=Xanthomonas massiliensis TaxID=1720302 RepID=UPI00098F7EC2|nr:TMEM175 family protein [Xanthomonas massiliensis]